MSLSKDTLTGLLFVVIGCVALFVARHYEFGTARTMGPGYFPMVLGGLIALLGAVLFVQSLLASGGERFGGFALRPTFFIVASIVAFALLVRPAGLILAVAAVVVLGRLGGREIRVGETILMAAVLALICTVLFIFVLGMPMPLLPR